MFWPFKRKEKRKLGEAPKTEKPNVVPVPQAQPQENIFNKDLGLVQGKLLFLEGIPHFVSALHPKTRSFTVTRITEGQWKKMQEMAKNVALKAAAAKKNPAEAQPNSSGAGEQGAGQAPSEEIKPS